MVFQTLKGSLQTWRGGDYQIGFIIISNPQRIATNQEALDKSRRGDQFQTLKGSLQTFVDSNGFKPFSNFKPSKDRYKRIITTTKEKDVM